MIRPRRSLHFRKRPEQEKLYAAQIQPQGFTSLFLQSPAQAVEWIKGNAATVTFLCLIYVGIGAYVHFQSLGFSTLTKFGAEDYLRVELITLAPVALTAAITFGASMIFGDLIAYIGLTMAHPENYSAEHGSFIRTDETFYNRLRGWTIAAHAFLALCLFCGGLFAAYEYGAAARIYDSNPVAFAHPLNFLSLPRMPSLMNGLFFLQLVVLAGELWKACYFDGDKRGVVAMSAGMIIFGAVAIGGLVDFHLSVFGSETEAYNAKPVTICPKTEGYVVMDSRIIWDGSRYVVSDCLLKDPKTQLVILRTEFVPTDQRPIHWTDKLIKPPSKEFIFM